MPKKAVKKKSKKKKAKAAKDPDDDEEKCPIEIPEYRDPNIYTPRAKLKIRLAEPIVSMLSKFDDLMKQLIYFVYSLHR